MPWPIPVLRPRPEPTPLRWRNWLATFVLVMTVGAALVLLLWPHDQSTQSGKFWILLFGAPAVVFMGMFGARLTYYEHAKLEQDVWAEKRELLDNEWAQWGRRCLRIQASCVFSSAGGQIDQWVQKDRELPVNLGRSLTLGWSFAYSAEQWVTHLLELVIERLGEHIERIKDLLVVEILVDPGTFAALRDTAFDSAKTLDGILVKRAIKLPLTVKMLSESGLERLYHCVDQHFTAPLLLIAGQRATDANSYSEGAVSLLIGTTDHRAPTAESHVRVYRPMLSNVEALYADLGQVRRIQGGADNDADIWDTGLDKHALGTIRKASSDAGGGHVANERDTLENNLDEVAGLAGPLSGWVALGLAIQAATRRQRSQLVVSANGSSAIAIVMARTNHSS